MFASPNSASLILALGVPRYKGCHHCLYATFLTTLGNMRSLHMVQSHSSGKGSGCLSYEKGPFWSIWFSHPPSATADWSGSGHPKVIQSKGWWTQSLTQDRKRQPMKWTNHIPPTRLELDLGSADRIIWSLEDCKVMRKREALWDQKQIRVRRTQRQKCWAKKGMDRVVGKEATGSRKRWGRHTKKSRDPESGKVKVEG